MTAAPTDPGTDGEEVPRGLTGMRPASYSVLVGDALGDDLAHPAIAPGPRSAAEDLLAELAQEGVAFPTVAPADAEGLRLRWPSEAGDLTEVVITAGLTYELYHRPTRQLLGLHRVTADSHTAVALLIHRLPHGRRQDAVSLNERAASARQLRRLAADLQDQDLALAAAAGGPDWVRDWLLDRAEKLEGARGFPNI